MTRIALISAMGGGTVACSSDASRLGEPFSNPFSSSEPSATGSLGDDAEAVPTRAPAIRTPRIQSEALAAPSGSMTPRSIPSASPSTPMASGSVSGMNPSGMNPSGMNPGGMNPDAGRGKKASAPAPAMTPRASAPQHKLNFVQGAKPAEKPVKVAEVQAKPVVEAKPAKVEAKVEAKPVAKVAEKPAAKASEAKPAKAEAKVDAKLEAKKAEAARKEAEAKAAKADAAKEATGNAAKKVAEAKAAEAAAKAASKDAAKEAKRAAKETPAPVKIASADPVAPIAAAPVAAPAAAANEAFRWPAKGRIINAYGTSGNEGINIAVPEGTPVKAAEEGTVAYAGSDVKGYGKLVLVRHNNGYVSAYAHNGELDVKPGEKVKRGQVIAKSGATGNVTSPQLHFEIRKGATPVDPMPHLGG